MMMAACSSAEAVPCDGLSEVLQTFSTVDQGKGGVRILAAEQGGQQRVVFQQRFERFQTFFQRLRLIGQGGHVDARLLQFLLRLSGRKRPAARVESTLRRATPPSEPFLPALSST